MQENCRQSSGLLKSKYMLAFICFILISSVYDFNIIYMHHGTIKPDIYLVLNLAVPALLWFFIGHVIVRWAFKAEGTISVIKMMIAVPFLVIIDQFVQVILSRYSGTFMLIIGDWLIFNAALSDRYSSLSVLDIFPLTNLVMAVLTIFIYRYICFKNTVNKRLMGVFVILAVAIFLCRFMSLVIHRGIFSFLIVRNFFDIHILDFYVFTCFFTGILCIFYKNSSGNSGNIISKLGAYFKYEKKNIIAIFSRPQKRDENQIKTDYNAT